MDVAGGGGGVGRTAIDFGDAFCHLSRAIGGLQAFRAISSVAAPCCSTEVAIAVDISRICEIVPAI